MADTEHGYRSTQPNTNGVSAEAYDEGSRAGRASGEVSGHERPNREQQAGLEAAHHEEEHCSNNGDNGDDVYDKEGWVETLKKFFKHDPRISEKDRKLLDPSYTSHLTSCYFVDVESAVILADVILERRKRSAAAFQYPSDLWFPDDGVQMLGIGPEEVAEIRKVFKRRGGYNALKRAQLDDYAGGLENDKEGVDGSANLGANDRHHSGPVDLATRHSEDRSLNDYTEPEIEKHLPRRRQPLEEYTEAGLEEHLRRRREGEINPGNKIRDDAPAATSDESTVEDDNQKAAAVHDPYTQQ